MSQRLIRATVLAVLVVASGAAAGNQQVAQPPLSRDARWQEDLTFFSTEFAARQKDFATLYPPERFHKAIAALRQGAATWSDARMTLELMRLVASAGVAHTVVHFPSGPQGFHRLPLGLAWYSDGLAVLSASAPYQGALGTRVVRIGSMTPSELEAAVAPFIAHENPFWLQQLSPRYMATVELLHLVGAVDAIGPVQFTLARPDGPAFELQVAPAAPAAAVTLSSMYDVLPIPAMLSRKQLQKNYWFEYLPASRSLYIQYNRCQEDPALPFTEFARQVFAAAEAAPVERTIVDLRLNAGGNSRVIEPLLAGLKARPALIARGRLLALVGRSTFSSGLMAAISLKKDLKAVLIGEPTGEKPNSYGEVRQLTLPHSRLSVSYTTKFFRLSREGDPAALFPDVTVMRSLADALAGRDPVFDAALRHTPR